jgi:hypothetical protein
MNTYCHETVPAETTASVYSALDEHQKTLTLSAEQQLLAGGFGLDGWLKELQRWKEIFTFEFKLTIPPVAFCIKSTRANCLGYFRPGHNEFGLTREIAINRRYLLNREPWGVLGTLLHELLHAWQDKYGKPGKRNYHNAELRDKALQYGLLIDPKGVTNYEPDSLFMDLLKKYGVQVPAALPLVITSRGGGNSKLKKWTCACGTNVRVAVAHFRALCLNCKQEFVQQSN